MIVVKKVTLLIYFLCFLRGRIIFPNRLAVTRSMILVIFTWLVISRKKDAAPLQGHSGFHQGELQEGD